MADDSRIPRVVIEASATRSLPLGAADGFVLSRIDGKTSEKGLASLTGLPESQIRASLDKLLTLGVVSFTAAPPPRMSNPALVGDGVIGALPSGESGSGPVASKSSLLDEAIANIPANTPELAEEVDIPLELRRRILGLHSVISSLDHYAVLGVERDIDKKGVKRAYFELAALFHPDRYFRKNIGSFKAKMEVIFAKVSVAYEALVDKTQRAEYDVYLGDVEKSRQIEAMLRNVVSEVETAEQSILEAAGGPPQLGAGPTPAIESARPPAPSGAPAAPARSSVADQLRRDALAKRLKGAPPAAKPPVQMIGSVPPPGPKINPAEAVDALRRRYEERVDSGRRQQGEKYVKLAEMAESRNDLTAAAAAYRVALTFLREEDRGYARAKEIILKSEASLGETYMRQADHEERANRWEDALRSWGRAAKLRPNDHRTLERYANALLHNNGDMHEAAQCAQKAIALAPTLGDYRCTLASVYVAAGLALNAKRELEAASLQFPQNPNIQAQLKKLSKPA